MSEPGRGRDKASWRNPLLTVLQAWNRHQVWRILTSVVLIWIVSGTALHFVERGTNPAFGQIVGMDFVAAANVFLPDRTNMKACLLIGLYRGETMMLNPVGGESGPLREGDELILLSQTLPDLSQLKKPRDGA